MCDETIGRLLGRRLRQRRRLLDLTQREVADRCGLTFQLIHKYEAGLVHLSVARLLLLTDVLRIPVHEILEGLQDAAAAADRPALAPIGPVRYLREVVANDHAISA
jgi:transcriptional regulator with XRE-family HTH domain